MRDESETEGKPTREEARSRGRKKRATSLAVAAGAAVVAAAGFLLTRLLFRRR